VRRFPLKAFPPAIRTTAFLRFFDNGQLVFCADKVTQFCNGFSGSEEVSEFPSVIKRGGVPNYMIVDMGFVDMGANNKSVFTFEEARSEIITNLICFLR